VKAFCFECAVDRKAGSPGGHFLRYAPYLRRIAEADDSDSCTGSIDVHLLNHVTDEAEHVRLEIAVVHVTCRVYQKQYVSLLSARSTGFHPIRIYQTSYIVRSNVSIFPNE